MGNMLYAALIVIAFGAWSGCMAIDLARGARWHALCDLLAVLLFGMICWAGLVKAFEVVP